MSFKLKKWGCSHIPVPTDHYSGYRTGTGLGISNIFVQSWAGRILYTGYDADNGLAPIFLVYRPVERTWQGPYAGPSVTTDHWGVYSNYTGDSCRYTQWGGQWCLSEGLPMGGYANDAFFGIDANFQLTEWPRPALPDGSWSNTASRLSGGMGCYGGSPARTLYQFFSNGLYTPGGEKIISYGPWGQLVDAEASWDDTYYGGGLLWKAPPNAGVPAFGVVLLDSGLLVWNNDLCSNPNDAYNLHDHYPTSDADACGSVILPINVDPTSYLFWDGETYASFHDYSTSSYYWAKTTDPTTPVTLPFTTWEYRRSISGADHDLSEGDLDGLDHGYFYQLPSRNGQGHPVWITYGDGHYVCNDNPRGDFGKVWVLDPHQPPGMARKPAKLGTSAIGYIGNHAIRPSLRVEDVLPEGYSASLTARGMLARSDGVLLDGSHAYKKVGGALTHTAAIRVDATSYPWTNGGFLWPGMTSNGGFSDGFYAMFAEGPTGTIWARMPDDSFGMWWFNGLLMVEFGQGFGVLESEDLDAAPGGTTHILRSSQRVSSSIADFGTPTANSKRQLVSYPNTPDGHLLAYYTNALGVQQEPDWEAVVGKFDGSIWTKLLDFKTIGSPGLGETGWTVWSLAYIRPSRSLPNGGWLVGATLYFAPWGDSWEWDVGSRDATFRGSGKGYVPAIPGNDGPCPVEHTPVYMTAIDEWTVNRSLYGPDALLVYDNLGQFVECLSDETMYPADGREILVTSENVPRIIYRVYRQGTYSDFAEGWGAYHRLDTDEEIRAPLYACYHLEDAMRRIVPGAGRFSGFLDMYDTARSAGSGRWSIVPGLYDYLEPKGCWSPAGRGEIRLGLGGRSLTPLRGGPGLSESGPLRMPFSG